MSKEKLKEYYINFNSMSVYAHNKDEADKTVKKMEESGELNDIVHDYEVIEGEEVEEELEA